MPRLALCSATGSSQPDRRGRDQHNQEQPEGIGFNLSASRHLMHQNRMLFVKPGVSSAQIPAQIFGRDSREGPAVTLRDGR
jgi:hypothetical protein